MEKRYDLEERTLRFATDIGSFCDRLPRTIRIDEQSRQLIRCAGSIGANYIEANEALGRKDRLMRMRISRKEAKESVYWLRLISPGPEFEAERLRLLDEATQLMKIFGAIVRKLEDQNA
jgi:four helix bundle protein